MTNYDYKLIFDIASAVANWAHDCAARQGGDGAPKEKVTEKKESEQMTLNFNKEKSPRRSNIGYKSVKQLVKAYQPYTTRQPKHGEIRQCIFNACKRAGIKVFMLPYGNGDERGGERKEPYIENGRVILLHHSLPEWITKSAPYPTGKRGHSYGVDARNYNNQ
jgi:hypothetical protein